MPAAKEVSRCTPVKVEGSFVFEILGYSHHRGMGVGRFIGSDRFSLGGYDWEIRLYPDGQHTRDYIAIYLELLSKDAKVHASCDLRLVDQITKLPCSVHKTEPRMFCQNNDSRSAPPNGTQFIKRGDFEASVYLRDDFLQINCAITVMKKPRVSRIKPPPRIEVPPSDIIAHLGRLLEAKEKADVTFSVAGESFTAHRIILAMRSPVFDAELYGQMRETRAQLVTIEEMQPDVFKALLYFIYNDALPSAFDDLEREGHIEMVRHLLVAADRYAMERLKLLCQSLLCENINSQTVATTLGLADQHHCDDLKEACIEFMSTSHDMDAVVATPGYENLKRNSPYILVDVLERSSKLRKT
ncbi:hypothetical protein ZWY2020_050241 [Hordeum vulgare]|nr:hypothetical protein ZWY2020_050241 [Hordeum vulgare]